MAELLLDSLEIKGYRCFEHLTIEKLGRVNLIVGKNNVGKTALLEALWIYANHNNQDILHKIIFERDEITEEKVLSTESLRKYNFAIKNLFSNRPNTPTKNQALKESPSFMICDSKILEFIEKEKFEFNLSEDNLSEDNGSPKTKVRDALIKAKGGRISIVHYYYDLNFGFPQTVYLPNVDRNIENLFIRSIGLQNQKLVEFWDLITLTPSEDNVIEALQLLLPKLNRISFIGYPKGSEKRVPVIRVENGIEPLPLKSFGEGMNRLLGLSLALVQCRDGMLLIDEIEGGFHYSVLPDVWKLIFKTAKDLNVQVFATTHSKDCIEAFTQAAVDDEESEGMLIRLERNKDDKIIAKNFDEESLETIERRGIEVR